MIGWESISYTKEDQEEMIINKKGRPVLAQGFTLVELLVTVSIVMVVAAIATPQMLDMVNDYRVKKSAYALAAMIDKAGITAASLRQPMLLAPYSGANNNWGLTLKESESTALRVSFSSAEDVQLRKMRPTWVMARFKNISPLGVAEVVDTEVVPNAISVLPQVQIQGLVFWPDGRVSDLQSSTNMPITNLSFRICATEARADVYEVVMRYGTSALVTRSLVRNTC